MCVQKLPHGSRVLVVIVVVVMMVVATGAVLLTSGLHTAHGRRSGWL